MLEWADICCYLAIKKLAMSFEHDLIKKVVGEELYHELCTELGGLQMSFKKGNKESVFYYYNKGMPINEIAYKMGVTERFVRQVINEKLQAHKYKKELFD